MNRERTKNQNNRKRRSRQLRTKSRNEKAAGRRSSELAELPFITCDVSKGIPLISLVGCFLECVELTVGYHLDSRARHVAG